MSKIDIIRAWKDESYRLGLSNEQRALLPESPAGPVELGDADLTGAGGEGASAMASTVSTTFCGSFCLCLTKSVCTYCHWC